MVRDGALTRSGSLAEMPAQLFRMYEGKLATQLLADIRAVHPVDADVRALFAQSGWTPGATLHVTELTLPTAIGFQNMGLGAPGPGPKVSHSFDELAEISSAGGLDFRAYASMRGELIQILLEREWDGTGRFPPVGHAIIVDRRIVGAWVLVLPQGDLYTPAQREAALSALPRDPPTPTAIPNRFPQGVNLARDHGLAETFALSVKNPDLSGGQTQDRAVIGPIVEALDALLPTQAPPQPKTGQPMIVLIWAGDLRMDRFFTLEYWADADLLVNRSFGYAAHPPGHAIELLRAVR
jgi:hypothetical protein